MHKDNDDCAYWWLIKYAEHFWLITDLIVLDAFNITLKVSKWSTCWRVLKRCLLFFLLFELAEHDKFADNNKIWSKAISQPTTWASVRVQKWFTLGHNHFPSRYRVQVICDQTVGVEHNGRGGVGCGGGESACSFWNCNLHLSYKVYGKFVSNLAR